MYRVINSNRLQHMIRFKYDAPSERLKNNPECTSDIGAINECQVAFFSMSGKYDESTQIHITIPENQFFKFPNVRAFNPALTERNIKIPQDWFEYRIYTRKVKLVEKIPGFKPKHEYVWMQIAIPEENVLFKKRMAKMQALLNKGKKSNG